MMSFAKEYDLAVITMKSVKSIVIQNSSNGLFVYSYMSSVHSLKCILPDVGLLQNPVCSHVFEP